MTFCYSFHKQTKMPPFKNRFIALSDKKTVYICNIIKWDSLFLSLFSLILAFFQSIIIYKYLTNRTQL